MTEELISFPTKKPHISFSEVGDWRDCTFRHKLIHIDKIVEEVISPFFPFGTGVHGSCEDFLKTRIMDVSIAEDIIKEGWEEQNLLEHWDSLPDYVQKYDRDPEEWIKMAHRILEDVPRFMDQQFPGWEYVAAEEKLYESIENHDIKFKGYVDAIIKVPKKNGYIYWIIDWKTAGWGWPISKKRDFRYQAQLMLYKIYWSQKHNIPLKDIRTGFVLLKRDFQKKNLYCELVPVSVGDKSRQKSLKLVDNMIKGVKKGLAIKNRTSCKFCQYAGTSHCT